MIQTVTTLSPGRYRLNIDTPDNSVEVEFDNIKRAFRVLVDGVPVLRILNVPARIRTTSFGRPPATLDDPEAY